ncbi:MAG: hypothetical protein GXO43_03860 [Crenarchaeota archaeon]|nr:hypothetical protein [Thermoproteota archaeon]
MTVVMGLGTLGTNVAPAVGKAIGADKVVLVDSKDGLQSGIKRCKDFGLEFDYIPVSIGSATGAHRDYSKAKRKAARSSTVLQLRDRFVEATKELYKSDKIPVLVWGLGGATGASVSYVLSSSVPYALHFTVLPDPSSPEPLRLLAENALRQINDVFMRNERHPVIIGNFARMNVDEIINTVISDHELYSTIKRMVDKRQAQNAGYIRKRGKKIRLAFFWNDNIVKTKISKIKDVLLRISKSGDDLTDIDVAMASINSEEPSISVDFNIKSDDSSNNKSKDSDYDIDSFFDL